jgi:hypothetical protein
MSMLRALRKPSDEPADLMSHFRRLAPEWSLLER